MTAVMDLAGTRRWAAVAQIPRARSAPLADEKSRLAAQRQVAIAGAEARSGGQTSRRGLFHDMPVQHIGRLFHE